MKKIIIIILFIAIISTSLKADSIIIPANAIRFRVIGNSDTLNDQNIKMEIKEDLEKEIYQFLATANSLNEAQKKLTENLENINAKISSTLISNNITYGFNVNYGMNYFPNKEYKGTIYEAGEYESLVITLGEGKGENWWCVLFPPLCLLEAEDNNTSDVEYKSFVKELIDKFIK